MGDPFDGLPCGRGGRQEGKKRMVAGRFPLQRDVGVQQRCTLEADLGAPKRRQPIAGAILGVWSRSWHGRDGQCIFFLQMWRIFIDREMGSIAGDAPSGKFPGGGAGA